MGLGRGAGDADAGEGAGLEAGGRLEDDDLVAGRAARPAGGVAQAGAFDEDFLEGADEALVGGDAAQVLVFEQDLVAAHLLGVGDVVRHVGGGGAGAGRVFEDEGVVEACGVHERARLLEVVGGLAGEADDDVGGEGEVGHGFAQAADGVEVVGAGVAAAHEAEDAV